ncbi:DivIVA domain-containing protein [Kineosphaera limosa]|uniref:Cell division protein DivIVA n=1 Tax=Kineosphaera limosa NBRC 100340 TaxID=1184609 RepID=K6WQB3_9MICO|nr:DivIVA domain-containing protein [Kineosphaera limosa]NYE02459.1 DivIVA domain-containing protein [Kineosphaera limosa]GAB96016.1 hypothetical protein KILIM_030_00590 [Kineosphaera limosa NBRC 100340]
MIVLLVVTVILLVGLACAGFLLRDRISLHPAAPTSSMGGGLPAGPLVGDDIAGVRFDTVLRGYRMDQVDDVLARLRDELARRDADIELLRELESTALRTVPPGQAQLDDGFFGPAEPPTVDR